MKTVYIDLRIVVLAMVLVIESHDCDVLSVGIIEQDEMLAVATVVILYFQWSDA
jgi:hypothetical protein